MSTDRAKRSLRNLQTAQRRIVLSFKLIRDFVRDYNADTHSSEVPVRLEAVIDLWREFGKVQAELEALDDSTDALDKHLKERAEFETAYYHVKGFLIQHCQTPIEASIHAPPTQSHESTHVKLPDIKLPKFNGDFEEWLNFHDLFISLVHSSTELSSIEKFYYLRSSLIGEASERIQTIKISAINYPVAWNLLVEHYQKPRVLKRKYVQALFEFPVLRRESAADLHSLVEKFETNVRVLNQLGERTEFWDILLVHCLTNRLDPVTRRDWEDYSTTNDAVQFKDLTDFIQRRVNVLQQVSSKSAEPQQYPQFRKPNPPRFGTHGAFQENRDRKCIVQSCPEEHTIYRCRTFAAMPLERKQEVVRDNKLCFNCLRKGHFLRNCSSESRCSKCEARHHTQLCTSNATSSGRFGQRSFPVRQRPPSTAASSVVDPPASSSNAFAPAPVDRDSSHSGVSSCTGHCDAPGSSKVVLATAVVIIVDDAGREHLARALLDSGSECCFASNKLFRSMKVKPARVDLPISGIGKVSEQVKLKFQSRIKSRTSDYTTSVEFLILPKVTIDLPSINLDTAGWSIPSGLVLADPAFHKSSPIDLVLGAELFFDLFPRAEHIPLGDYLPMLVNSVFGWIVSGKTICSRPNYPALCNVATIDDVHTQMERFWVIEEDKYTSNYSPDETRCEQHFQQTVTRNAEGRYVVRLPVKEDLMQRLGDNRKSALHRFYLLESRLTRDEELGRQYRDFMKEYLDLGHMRRADTFADNAGPNYYMPHHPVVRESSTTTKVRVVFDASNKTSTGISLNDALLVGPVVQEDLRYIVMRSRIHPIVLIADCEKMYRQILVHPDDTPKQKIFWRFLADEPISTYELQTVTYGTSAAPFLATRVLKQLAQDEAESFPIAAKVVERDFYVDDLFSGAATPEAAIELRLQLEKMLARGGFLLRKWASNNESVLEGVLPENRALKDTIDLDRDQTIKTLGLHWEPATDHLKYKIDLPIQKAVKLTKRQVLSYIAQLFDPLGLVGPVILKAKVFMQMLWTLLDENGKRWLWDQELPERCQHEWLHLHTQLPLLNHLRIDRFALLPNVVEVELGLFSDASEVGYGSVAYLRTVDKDRNIKVTLLTSRSRVAPLKKRCISRLELCGCELSAELYEQIYHALQIPLTPIFWTDSTTVLAWLRAPPSTWTPFVAHRVAKIQLITEGFSWFHIAGCQNPADIISRGCYPADLLDLETWWSSVEWYELSKDNWPVQVTDANEEEVNKERRKTPVVLSSATVAPSFIDAYIAKFSNFQSMIRKTACWLRFFKNRCLPDEKRIFGWLTTAELRNAEYALIRRVQLQCFPTEWKQLQGGNQVSSSSRLRWFNPMLSPDDNVIRIGGRLDQAAQSEDFKHPVILPGSHPFTTLLIRYYHGWLLHAAPQLLVNTIRLRYWILGGRSAARQVVHKCVSCARAKPKRIEQFMSELPAARVTESRPFSVTGIDFWGPIYLQPRHRKAASTKAYVAVFVCFSTKAVHIELVADLTTAKFLQAFRRFVSRRGLCSHVYTDNGKNFVGAANELGRLVRSSEWKEQMAKECTSEGITWHFNPPKGSHFGGLWEAAINSAQKHFVRVLGTRLLGFDDMETLLAQIECCLNSRPLTPLSDDPSDSVPDVNLESIQYNRLTKWQQTQKMVQDIWRRWQREYLATLQARTKWIKPAVKIEKDRLVVILDENLPPTRWSTGRIHELHPGKDEVVRVVTLQTANGFVTRPVSKLCFLPVATSESDGFVDPTTVVDDQPSTTNN